MKLFGKIIILHYMFTFLFHQTSFGQAWVILNEPSSGCQEIEILDNGIIAVTSTTGVFVSLDKTRTWAHTLNTYNVLNFKSDNLFYALGGVDAPFLYVSNNAGTNWNNIVNSEIAEPYVTELAIRNSNEFYVLATVFGGENTHIYKTTDGGTNWVLQSTDAKDFRSFIAGEENILYGLDYNNGFFVSFDDGITWENKINGITSNVFYSLALTENGELFISTSGGKLYYSTNNGDTWFSRTEYFDSNSSLVDLKISSTGNIYVVAEDSASISVHKSTDQGITWMQVGDDFILPTMVPFNSRFGDMDLFTDEKIILIVEGHLYSSDTLFTTSVENELSSNYSYTLSQNYPNPFNPSTTITYSIPKRDLVQLKVYDILGKEIETLVNEEKPSGKYSIKFNISSVGGELSSGVYIYTLRVSNFVQSRKMILLR